MKLFYQSVRSLSAENLEFKFGFKEMAAIKDVMIGVERWPIAVKSREHQWKLAQTSNLFKYTKLYREISLDERERLSHWNFGKQRIDRRLQVTFGFGQKAKEEAERQRSRCSTSPSVSRRKRGSHLNKRLSEKGLNLSEPTLVYSLSLSSSARIRRA
jgi:hypothetical protein